MRTTLGADAGGAPVPAAPIARRQPIHTVYGGAHLFKATTPARLGEIARASLAEHAPDAAILARVLDLPGDAALHERVYARTVAKLTLEPVEDLRIDFEDGYGPRADAEEDAHVEGAARELAIAMRDGGLPPFIGIRTKSLAAGTARRAIRTLDGFVSTLLDATGGVLPANFVVTLPKVERADQVIALAHVLDALEAANRLPAGAIAVEVMVESPRALVDREGRLALPGLVAAAAGRCRGVHFGAYDYTAAIGVIAAHQTLDHRACDVARDLITLALADTGVTWSDGATTLMPIGPHRGALSAVQKVENTAAVHRAWRASAHNVRRALVNGWIQGWDLHPAQLPARYATTFAFFLADLPAATARLANFVDKAARATLVGDQFDDAATGQGLLNTFVRALDCGAVDADELIATGLTADELRTRSFAAIVAARRTDGRHARI